MKNERTPDSEQPILNVEGDRVALGPLRKDLLPLYTRWINDFETALMVGGFQPFTAERETEWYESAARSDDSLPFTIYELATLRPIGTSSLVDVDHRNRRATFGIAIGEPDCRSKGYGTETTRLMLDYAFNVVGLHSVMLRVFDFNPAAVRAYKKAGFREFGRRRKSYLAGGKLQDEIYMECLSDEFESPVIRRAFAPDEPR